nr:translation initiation factor IF-2-like [Chlorocebus sabaeus]
MRSPPPTPPGAANGAPTCTRAGAAAGGGKAAVSRDNEQGVQAARPGTPGPKGAVRPVQGSGRRLSLPPRLPHPTGVRLPQKGLRRSWAGRWVRPPGTSRRLRLGLRDWGAQGLRPPRSPRSPRSPRPARPGCRDVALTYHSSESGTARRRLRLRGRRLPALRMRGPAPPRGTPHPAQAPPRPRPVLKPRPGRRSSTGLNPRGGREPVGVGAGGRPDSAEAGRAAALGVPTAHQGLIRSRYRGAAREAGPEARSWAAVPRTPEVMCCKCCSFMAADSASRGQPSTQRPIHS